MNQIMNLFAVFKRSSPDDYSSFGHIFKDFDGFRNFLIFFNKNICNNSAKISFQGFAFYLQSLNLK